MTIFLNSRRAIVLAVASLCLLCAADGQEPTPIAAGVAEADLQLHVDAYLEPYRSIEISSVESGVIAEILVSEGQAVTEGQELIKLDNAVQEAQLQVALAQAEGKGRVMAAEADYELQSDRLRKLQALGSNRTNEAEIERQKATTKSTEGLLLAAQEEMKIFELSAARIREEIERRILKSPINGVVVEIVKDVAEPVSTLRSQSGEPDYLIRVVQLEALKMTPHLPYGSAESLKIGDKLPVVTEVTTGQAARVEGVVEFVSPIIKSSTSTVAVTLRIDNPDLRLRGGSAATVLVKKR